MTNFIRMLGDIDPYAYFIHNYFEIDWHELKGINLR